MSVHEFLNHVDCRQGIKNTGEIMKIWKFAAALGASGMLLAGLGATAAAAAPASTKPAATSGTRNHPTVFTADRNGTSSSPYRHGRLYISHGPSAWLSHPHFTRWNATEAKATGALWGADSGVFSLGHHVTLVFSHTGGRMGYYFFTHLDIDGSHGIARHWHMSRPSPHGNTWVPDGSGQ
jgi:hypothetical protein